MDKSKNETKDAQRKVGSIMQALRTLFPLTAFNNAPNPEFVQNLSQRLFLRVSVRGTGICQKFVHM